MNIENCLFGTNSEGKEIMKYTLQNDRGMEVDIISYGAIVSAIRMPDKHHEPGDVVLGFETMEEYLGDHPYFGAVCGRVCNRIGNARLEIEGRIFKLNANEGSNQLHGGIKGFDKKVWTTQRKKTEEQVSVILAYESQDGEEGYPGTLMIEVEYSLNNENELGIVFRAKTDKTTHVNLTNHSYFNLNSCRGDVHAHELLINSSELTELNDESIPTGNFVPVEGTAYDFRISKAIGEHIGEIGMGYDINYVLDKQEGVVDKVAAVFDPESGRSMEVLTNLPGIQLYTANYVDGIRGKNGLTYEKHSAVCLETQYFPDAANHPQFLSTELKPGEEFSGITIYRFSW